MKKQVIFIGNGQFILSNITRLVMNCHDYQKYYITNSLEITALTKIIQMPCGCTAMADHIYIPKLSHDCPAIKPEP